MAHDSITFEKEDIEQLKEKGIIYAEGNIKHLLIEIIYKGK